MQIGSVLKIMMRWISRRSYGCFLMAHASYNLGSKAEGKIRSRCAASINLE